MYSINEDIDGMVTAIDSICQKAAQAAIDNYQLIVLSDKRAGKRLVPIRFPLIFHLSMSQLFCAL